LNNCFIVDGEGKGGGLALYWHDELKIDILSYTMHHIDTLIWDGEHHVGWWGTFVYGEPQTQERKNMWELLKWIMPCSRAPWMMIRNFNEAMWSFEHFSTR
jgi:hypothetical protein